MESPNMMKARVSAKGRVVDPVDEFYGKLAGEISLTDALLEERTKEVRREEARLRTG
jgi:hypothetical protein